MRPTPSSLRLALLLFVASVTLANVARAEYSNLYQALVDGDSSKFRDRAFEEIRGDSSAARKREILSVLSVYRDKFYSLADFDGKVVSLDGEACQKTSEGSRPCASEGGFDFFVDRQSSRHVLTVKRQGKVLLSYDARSRTSLAKNRVGLGKAIHFILPRSPQNDLYLLIREIESDEASSVPVLQTVSAFLVRDRSVCKIAEVDGEAEGHYALLVELIRAFGSKFKCPQDSIRL